LPKYPAYSDFSLFSPLLRLRGTGLLQVTYFAFLNGASFHPKKKSRHNVTALRKLTNNKGLPLPPNTSLDDILIEVACRSGTEVDLHILVDTA
jgi:hypothetical protein